MLIFLILLGLIAGSFTDALVWRIWQQEKPEAKNDPSLSILKGRSMCPNCRHILSARDLVPLFSWLSLGGRCRYCHAKIPKQAPLGEIGLAAVFALSYIYWPGNLALGGQKVLLATWLVCSVGLAALFLYDLRWMVLPNRILYPTFFVATVGRLIYIVGYSSQPVHLLAQWGWAILVASGIFWIIFMASSGKWIGYGDVRLGLITGTLLASPAKSVLMIVFSAFAGTIVMLPILASRKSVWHSRIAYGPFLILATFLVVLFGQSIIDWYVNLASASTL